MPSGASIQLLKKGWNLECHLELGGGEEELDLDAGEELWVGSEGERVRAAGGVRVRAQGESESDGWVVAG